MSEEKKEGDDAPFQKSTAVHFKKGVSKGYFLIFFLTWPHDMGLGCAEL